MARAALTLLGALVCGMQMSPTLLGNLQKRAADEHLREKLAAVDARMHERREALAAFTLENKAHIKELEAELSSKHQAEDEAVVELATRLEAAERLMQQRLEGAHRGGRARAGASCVAQQEAWLRCMLANSAKPDRLLHCINESLAYDACTNSTV